MLPDSKKLLFDMREAAQAIAEFTRGRALDDLRGDDILRSAVYYQFIIIGEAMSQLRQQDPSTAQRLSEYNRIIGFRNQIIHGYSIVDHETTWRIIELKLPILIKELGQLLT
ncbi:MAG: DUF86 domain-containing protein [Phycisphaerae bacterium]